MEIENLENLNKQCFEIVTHLTDKQEQLVEEFNELALKLRNNGVKMVCDLDSDCLVGFYNANAFESCLFHEKGAVVN